MTMVWELDLASTDKLVLLALADNANDDGTCWPSIRKIAEKSSLSERAVQNAISRLRDAGKLQITERYGRSNLFTITPAGNAPPQEMHPAPNAPTPAADAPSPPHVVRPGGARGAPITIIESSSESSREPSRTTARKGRASPDPLEFFDLKIAYPNRAGDQGWRKALRAVNARLAEGYTWIQIIDGAKRYAAYVRATCNEDTQYVKQACAFVGPDLHFLSDWKLPQTKSGARLKSNITAAEEFMRRTEPTLETV
jgi:biotin operon repressor